MTEQPECLQVLLKKGALTTAQDNNRAPGESVLIMTKPLNGSSACVCAVGYSYCNSVMSSTMYCRWGVPGWITFCTTLSMYQ